ncbi:hypothetical protein EDD17DRAFT_1504854 [Pisolithus thermaeus]|nr:hypothetical protein EV401DRAFT_1896092 [Pisolithus croceorrhizus]KAI6167154.1 hypothetical protein EDD17DRAFT_1504854 [Pisolithus thermaeus]
MAMPTLHRHCVTLWAYITELHELDIHSIIMGWMWNPWALEFTGVVHGLNSFGNKKLGAVGHEPDYNTGVDIDGCEREYSSPNIRIHIIVDISLHGRTKHSYSATEEQASVRKASIGHTHNVELLQCLSSIWQIPSRFKVGQEANIFQVFAKALIKPLLETF